MLILWASMLARYLHTTLTSFHKKKKYPQPTVKIQSYWWKTVEDLRGVGLMKPVYHYCVQAFARGSVDNKEGLNYSGYIQQGLYILSATLDTSWLTVLMRRLQFPERTMKQENWQSLSIKIVVKCTSHPATFELTTSELIEWTTLPKKSLDT